ncbi:MAG: [FeFe] hydrogenase H-cluster radical SAM maturase HydG [Planctomycetes bacterium]|nr:[FeFe] hydrogenase H-cluster radical SAM maturase HydG [Planctomycetota bacterium]
MRPTTQSKALCKWAKSRIREEEITRYMENGQSFLNEGQIVESLAAQTDSDSARIEDILQKSLSIQTLTLEETATLLNVTDPALRARMEAVAGQVKRDVYDNRIVTFAPLYLGNLCVNECAYCGFRCSNKQLERSVLSQDQIRRETEVLTGEIGHKRLIVVYGEHPSMDVQYMIDSLKTIGDVRIETRRGSWSQIHRCNVNAPPLPIDELKRLKDVGIGTFQVFQETYHQATYGTLHPSHTLKGHYLWRLYSMHRAMEAGVDDVGIGALFGLYDWRFEVMSLIAHAIELEQRFGVGPHTISFPRMEDVPNTPFVKQTRWKVDDDAFRRLVTVIRLAVPHTGMILTARESAEVRRQVLPLGCTQMDASSRIGLCSYDKTDDKGQGQDKQTQQFMLGDTRSLDTVIRELAEAGYITSFCTAGYRCGRTGGRIMELLKCGKEGNFCKLNAVITYREWLDDFASPETKAAGEKVIAREVDLIRQTLPDVYEHFMTYYKKTEGGARDLFF